MVLGFFSVLSSLLLSAPIYAAYPYCQPEEGCWPQQNEWDKLNETMDGILHHVDSSMYQVCQEQGDDAYAISDSADGICMQYHNCARAFCDVRNDWNLPEYTAQVYNTKDLQEVVAFANTYNLQLTIKTSGHSFSGSSTAAGSLLIWLKNLTKYNTVQSFTDSCGETTTTTMRVGGGTIWGEVYTDLGADYHFVGGGALTVSAAGGWLMGSGLSALSPTYGIGIDNVLAFEVVLGDGSLVTADACENPDLFWALRGGGGGAFGIVASVYYKLYPTESTVVYRGLFISEGAQEEWVNWWVDNSPWLDSGWGGIWTPTFFAFFYVGTMEDAERSLVQPLTAWHDTLPPLTRAAIRLGEPESFPSYWLARGGENTGTDATGEEDFYTASRLVPREWVLQNRDAAVKTLLASGPIFNYLLGGQVTKPGPQETSVHPAMRRALWQIEPLDEVTAHLWREAVPNNITGCGYNHAAKNEPDWHECFWGDNYARLRALKDEYDPNGRFNCWHCMGYQGKEEEEETISSSYGHAKEHLELALRAQKKMLESYGLRLPEARPQGITLDRLQSATKEEE